MKIVKWTRRTVSGVFIILLISAAILVISAKVTGGQPEIFGYQLKSVLSGSMEPSIQTGSIIAVKSVDEKDRSNFQSGDVITFIGEEDKLITHRITDVISTDDNVVYTTKGDSNNAPDPDPVLAENVIGVYNGFTIPYVGYIINFAQSPNGSILFMIIPGLLLLGYAGFTIWRTLKRLDHIEKKKPM
ncbi:Signal peptidase I . Serine peptidase. MEROPS family S26B [Lentibacillus halodurans]|uniref:Signal peptidase I n=1 Tax=Lentibacillus halodurans TaxID=237679 RepID=A0A1I1ADH3_9BACI|nr:signal peptidase I [Lentibacillus halodurans]SFB36049.1 Signal peptidase I . Serine peptidase. MEROPS family S26B [Lentibacillus halodurans]